MTISTTTLPALAPTSFSTVVGINALAASLDPLAQPAIAGVESGASIVELSKLGQLLSAATTFQAQQAAFDTANGVAGQGADIGSSFGKLIAATQLFVSAFNNLQSGGAGGLQNPLGAPSGNPLLLALTEQTIPGTGKSLLASLAQVGINFQEGSTPGSTGQFNIDLTVLQAAFKADPAGTSSLLAQAFQTLVQLAAKLVGQNVNAFGADASSAQLGNTLGGQIDVSTLAGPLANLNSADAATVNAALQRALADQALINALGANSTSAQAAVTANAEIAATTSETIAATNLAMTQNIATVGTIPIAAAATAVAANQAGLVNPAVTQQVLTAENTSLGAPASNTGALQATGIIAASGIPASIAQTLPAASAASSDATGAVGANLNSAQTAADLNLARFQAIDPSVAAAIAAYRVGDVSLGITGNNAALPLPEPIADVVAVTRVQPVTLDPHDTTYDAWLNETARNEVRSVEQRKVLPEFHDLLASRKAVNALA